MNDDLNNANQNTEHNTATQDASGSEVVEEIDVEVGQEPTTDEALEVEEADADTEQPEPEEDDLQEQLKKTQTEAAEYLDGWQRARAEFANYRKRMDREIEALSKKAGFAMLGKILPAIDDFERALDNVPDDLAEHTWVTGTSLIKQKIVTLLEDEGVTEINPVGEVFDPTRHEAVGTDDSDEVESGSVTVVLQKGYAHGDTVLRPAIVRVAN